jgi:hypothetical protein
MDIDKLRELSAESAVRSSQKSAESEHLRKQQQLDAKAEASERLRKAREALVEKIMANFDASAEREAKCGAKRFQVMFISQGGAGDWQRTFHKSFWTGRRTENIEVPLRKINSPVALEVIRRCKDKGFSVRVEWNSTNYGDKNPHPPSDKILGMEEYGHLDMFRMYACW